LILSPVRSRCAMEGTGGTLRSISLTGSPYIDESCAAVGFGRGLFTPCRFGFGARLFLNSAVVILPPTNCGGFRTNRAIPRGFTTTAWRLRVGASLPSKITKQPTSCPLRSTRARMVPIPRNSTPIWYGPCSWTPCCHSKCQHCHHCFDLAVRPSLSIRPLSPEAA